MFKIAAGCWLLATGFFHSRIFSFFLPSLGGIGGGFLLLRVFRKFFSNPGFTVVSGMYNNTVAQFY